MFSHSLWILVLLFCKNAFGYLTAQRVIRQSNDGSVSCTTPDGQAGSCVNLKTCPHIRDQLVSLPMKPEMRAFLEKSLCGREQLDKYPKVCCSISKTANFLAATPTSKESTSSSSESVSIDATPGDSEGTRFYNNTPTDASTSNEFSTCGKTTRSTWKVLGGRNVSLGDWPWMVAIGYGRPSKPGNTFRCGGSIISEKWVVTAAHCVKDIGNFTVEVVRIGELNLDEDVYDGAFPVDIPIDKIIPHPDYSTSPIRNDIALLGLKEDIVFNSQVRPICILSGIEYKEDEFYRNKAPFITGWGATSWRGPVSSILQETQLDIVERESCMTKYKNITSITITKNVLCAAKKRKDACQGDSGGPLMLPVKSSFYLAGIVSYGVGCGKIEYPGVYTKVAQYGNWISNVTGMELV